MSFRRYITVGGAVLVVLLGVLWFVAVSCRHGDDDAPAPTAPTAVTITVTPAPLFCGLIVNGGVGRWCCPETLAAS